MAYPDRDAEYLNKLRDYYAEARRIPSHQRVAELIGFSKTAAQKLLERLSSAGFIIRTPDNDAWMPTKTFFQRSLATSAVRAGSPEMIEPMQGELFLIDDYLVKKPSATIMIPVKGDSMTDAGINDGDLAVVERDKTAHPGDFVVAVVDDEFTLKELAKEKNSFVLKPHNKAFSIIRPKDALEIYGVMVGLVRRYFR